jgi:hypothetical protein
VCAFALSILPARAAAQSWEELETRRVVIGPVDISVGDVFDLGNGADDTWAGRAANAVHVRTRRAVIARELLFATGDLVNAARIHETERNLRRYPFIRDVRIVAQPAPDGTAGARVEVIDAWSLDAGVTLGRAGAVTSWGFHVEESNLAGTGKTLAFERERNRERTTSDVAFTDPQLLASRWTLALRHAHLSDGGLTAARIERPYYSIETPYSAGGFASRVRYSLTGYHLGEPAFAIDATVRSSAVYASRAVQLGGRTVFRFGAAYRAQQYTYGAIARASDVVPVPRAASRRLEGVSATWAFVQDRPATFENFAAIGRTEDDSLGWSISAETGYYARAMGSTIGAAFGDVAARKAWSTNPGRLVAIEAGASGRSERGAWHDAGLRAGVTSYDRRLPWQTIAARLDVAAVTRPDPESWLYLDSTAGLRGYVDHFLAGDRRAVISVEDRIITSRDVLGLVRVGFVVFADAGAIRRFDTGRWSRTFVDAGGGLRFGLLKGPRNNVVQIAVAVPLGGDETRHRALVVLGNVLRF